MLINSAHFFSRWKIWQDGWTRYGLSLLFPWTFFLFITAFQVALDLPGSTAFFFSSLPRVIWEAGIFCCVQLSASDTRKMRAQKKSKIVSSRTLNCALKYGVHPTRAALNASTLPARRGEGQTSSRNAYVPWEEGSGPELSPRKSYQKAQTNVPWKIDGGRGGSKEWHCYLHSFSRCPHDATPHGYQNNNWQMFHGVLSRFFPFITMAFVPCSS